MLDLQNVAIRFGRGPEAVSDTSFHVDARKRTVVIGETGSGKDKREMLLLAILGLLPPTRPFRARFSLRAKICSPFGKGRWRGFAARRSPTFLRAAATA